MYQPRRISDAAGSISVEVGSADAFVTGPRRAARTRVDVLRTRIAPTVVSLALLATAGSFALSLKASEGATTAVPAPVRADEAVSRDSVRELVTDSESTASPSAEVTAAANAFASGTWSSAFGAVVGEQYAQVATVVRAQASAEAAELGQLAAGAKVSVTDKTEGDFRQVSYDGKVGYVLASQLGDKAPAPVAKATASAKASSTAKASTYSGSTTYSGKSVLGLRPSAMVVYNAVMAQWKVPSVGGYRASSLSNHQLGLAIDFMVYNDTSMGNAIAAYLIANASTFNIDHIIYRQRIWTPYSPTWRAMANRGSATANHMDHVHVSMKS